MSDNPPPNYFHVSNMQSPIDQVDLAFLTILADYHIGPPKETTAKGSPEIIKDGVFGVYTTAEAISKPQVLKLSGFTVKALGTLKL